MFGSAQVTLIQSGLTKACCGYNIAKNAKERHGMVYYASVIQKLQEMAYRRFSIFRLCAHISVFSAVILHYLNRNVQNGINLTQKINISAMV